MAIFCTKNTQIVGISACVPKQATSNHNYAHIPAKERELLIKTTGIESRRVATGEQCTSDMCFEAARTLLKSALWSPESIDVLIWVSQSPDYHLPATSIILQDKLGLPKTSLAFDINLGCSGYVYGLSVMANMLQGGQLKRGLLLVGDKSTSGTSYQDKSTYPLFGDAGTATLLEYSESAAPMFFNLQSDGSGKNAIIIPDGGMRNPLSDDSFVVKEYEGGLVRHRKHLWLDGLEVFNFSLREVAPNVNALLSHLGHDIDNYDYFVFHQANKLMNESIRKKLRLPPEKVPYTLPKFGNTSSASIPLTMVCELSGALSAGKHRLLLSAFGVGLSWGSASVETKHLICPLLIEI